MSPVYVKFKIIVSLTTHKKWDILKDKLHRHIFMFIWIKIHLQIIQYFGVHSLSIKIALTKNTQKNLLLLNKCKLLMWQTNVKHFIKGFFFFFHLYFSLFFYCKMTQYQHENTVQRLIWYIYIWFMLTFFKICLKKSWCHLCFDVIDYRKIYCQEIVYGLCKNKNTNSHNLISQTKNQKEFTLQSN